MVLLANKHTLDAYDSFCRTYRVEDRCTLIVVQIRINVVDTNGVHTQDLHKGSVSKAAIFVGQRIGRTIEASTATRLVCDTDDLVSIASDIVDEVVSLDVDGGNGSSERSGADET